MLPIIGCAGFVSCLETHEGLQLLSIYYHLQLGDSESRSKHDYTRFFSVGSQAEESKAAYFDVPST